MNIKDRCLSSKRVNYVSWCLIWHICYTYNIEWCLLLLRLLVSIHTYTGVWRSTSEWVAYTSHLLHNSWIDSYNTWDHNLISILLFFSFMLTFFSWLSNLKYWSSTRFTKFTFLLPCWESNKYKYAYHHCKLHITIIINGLVNKYSAKSDHR